MSQSLEGVFAEPIGDRATYAPDGTSVGSAFDNPEEIINQATEEIVGVSADELEAKSSRIGEVAQQAADSHSPIQQARDYSELAGQAGGSALGWKWGDDAIRAARGYIPLAERGVNQALKRVGAGVFGAGTMGPIGGALAMVAPDLAVGAYNATHPMEVKDNAARLGHAMGVNQPQNLKANIEASRAPMPPDASLVPPSRRHERTIGDRITRPEWDNAHQVDPSITGHAKNFWHDLTSGNWSDW